MVKIRRKATVEEIKEYFLKPNKLNTPKQYAKSIESSIYLVNVINRLFPNKEITILELGSNVGRNLYYLNKSNYHNLYGIEGSRTYYEAIKIYFPKIFNKTYYGNIEWILDTDLIIKDKFKLIFTMAVLEHIPIKIEQQVFDAIKNKADFILTIEDEKCNTWNHYPRNYKEVFEQIDILQINAWKFPPLGNNFIMRLFKSG